MINEYIENINTNLTEASTHQKQRNNKDAEQLFRKETGRYNGIHTIVVLTVENPDSKQATNQFNQKERHSLLSDIKNGGYAYLPALGRFGNTERLYAVFNMSVNSAMILCGKYQQTSFVYSELKDDSSIHSEYHEKFDKSLPFNKKTNNYVKKDECDTWEDVSNADDDFTIIGEKFKYSIPFPMLNTVNETICENLRRAVAVEKERGNKTINENNLLDFTINRVGQSPYLWRKTLTKGL